MKGVPIDDDIVVWQIAQDKLIQPNTEANRRYSFNSAEGTFYSSTHVEVNFCSCFVLELREEEQDYECFFFWGGGRLLH